MSADKPSSGTNRRAVFLDRDGTIIEDAHYIARPEAVRFMPGAARAIRRLNEAALPVIVITNQSGIARGLLTEDAYEAVRRRLDDLLAAEGAHVDATYHCPHHPDFGGSCDCRKPGVALFERAARDHAVDLARSFFIGDKWRDIAPAKPLGGRGILVPSPDTPVADVLRAEDEAVISTTLGAAVDRVLASAAG